MMQVNELPRAGKCIDGNLTKFDRRERCKRCGQRNPIGFNVPDDVWERVNYLATKQREAFDGMYPSDVEPPPRGPYQILCIGCFIEVADWHGVEWERDIEFWPVSRYTSTVAEMEGETA